MGIADAAAGGVRLETLRAMRDGLALRLESCTSDQNFAVLSRTLADVLAQIDELGGGVSAPKEKTAVDEFTQRLSERKPAARPRRAAGD